MFNNNTYLRSSRLYSFIRYIIILYFFSFFFLHHMPIVLLNISIVIIFHWLLYGSFVTFPVEIKNLFSFLNDGWGFFSFPNTSCCSVSVSSYKALLVRVGIFSSMYGKVFCSVYERCLSGEKWKKVINLRRIERRRQKQMYFGLKFTTLLWRSKER